MTNELYKKLVLGVKDQDTKEVSLLELNYEAKTTKGLNNELFNAVKVKDTKKVKQLLDQGIDINAQDGRGVSLLLIFICEGEKEQVQILLENGANPNIKDINDMSVIMVACYQGDPEIVELLIKYGAIVNFCDKNGWTPLRMALSNNNEELAKLLIERDVPLF